jgi:hypothetical protein
MREKALATVDTTLIEGNYGTTILGTYVAVKNVLVKVKICLEEF